MSKQLEPRIVAGQISASEPPSPCFCASFANLWHTQLLSYRFVSVLLFYAWPPVHVLHSPRKMDESAAAAEDEERKEEGPAESEESEDSQDEDDANEVNCDVCRLDVRYGKSW